MSQVKVKIFIILSVFCFGFQQKPKTDSIAYYNEKNEPFKAILFLQKKAENELKVKNYQDYCQTLITKAEQLRNFDDTQGALEVLYEARKYAEKYHYNKTLILIYRNIGNINVSVYDIAKGKKFFNKAIALAKKTNDTEGLLNCYQSFSKLYFETNLDSTFVYLKKIDKLTKKLNTPKNKFKNYHNFCTYYYNKNDKILFKKYLDSTSLYIDKINDKASIANLYNAVGVYYIDNKNYLKANEYFEKILKLFPNQENKKIVSTDYLNLSYTYEQMGDYKKSNEYINKYINLNEEITLGRIEQKTKELDTKYAISKLEDEYKTKEKVLLATQRRNQIIILLSSFFLLAGILVVYFYYQNLILKQKNQIKDLDNELQFKVISATLDGQEEERSKISSVLHDSVSATLSSVGLHLSAFEAALSPEQREDLKKTRTLLKQAHDKVRDLSHNLIPPTLVKFGLLFAIKDLCEKNSNSLIQFEFETNLKSNHRFESEFESKMFFILSELINNTIKHSKATYAKIKIVQKEENKFSFSIKDNGIGFNPKETSISNGFGLTQIKARVKNMGGKLKINSDFGSTSITIETTV